MSNGQFKPGEPRPEGAGRKPGVPNKWTTSVKDALEEAFQELGGVPSLVQWGRREPGEFYKVWSKLLPRNIEIKGTLTLEQLVAESMKLIDAKVVEPPKLEASS